MNLHTQWITLLWMLACGGIMGMVFDGYRVVSIQFRFPRWSIHALDLLYWFASALFVFRTMYHTNQGEVRFYVFLGLFIGVWIHFLFLSVITERFVVMLIIVIKRFYRILVGIVRVVLIAPIRLLLKGTRLLLGFIWVMLLFLGRITLLPFWKLLLWATRPIRRRLRISDRLAAVRDWMKSLWRRWFHRE
ncbi:spore cortex biosynthesis protein YabQ [Paenibacillus motobuensis]|uniref:spore cortex biosynthesis protein YabQ n=1 Tax=Paenibacillus motobuensis TaxID=295324 RepID=UPI0031DEB53C